MAAAWLLFFVATLLWFPEPPARLPIGLARDSMLLPPCSVTVSPGPGSTRETSRASSGGSLPAHAAPGLPQGRAGGDSKEGLRQPLLDSIPSGVPAADLAPAAPADVEAAGGGPTASQPLLPHARRAQQQEAALHGDTPAERAAAAAWRATLPGTVACTAALLVQKMESRALVGRPVVGMHVCGLFRCRPSYPADSVRPPVPVAFPILCRCSRRTWTACRCSLKSCSAGTQRRRACSSGWVRSARLPLHGMHHAGSPLAAAATP